MGELVAVPVDDLGTPVPVAGVPARVVSLVPNLTEALWWWGRGDALVGVTDWCDPPGGVGGGVRRVRGTKNPDVAAVVALAPDLVVANAEENRRADVEALRAQGLAVHVTAPVDVEGAAASLALLGTTLGVQGPAQATADAIRTAVRLHADRSGTPPPGVAVPVWREPWLVVGQGTVVGSMLETVGFQLVPQEPRYPQVAPDVLDAADLVLLPDEPWEFTAADRDELRGRVPGRPVRLVDGRDLTWWGPRTPRVLAELAGLRTHLVRRAARFARRRERAGSALNDPG